MQRTLVLNSKVLPLPSSSVHPKLVHTLACPRSSLALSRTRCRVITSGSVRYASNISKSSTHDSRTSRNRSKTSGAIGTKGISKSKQAESRRGRPSLDRNGRQMRNGSPQPRQENRNRVELDKVINSLTLPTKEEVPTLPRDILRDPLHNMIPVITSLKGFSERTSVVEDMHLAILSCDDPTAGKIQLTAKAQTKTVARSAAYLQLLAKLHEKGLAGTYFPLTGLVGEDEKDALLDIYLFAAKYQDIPEITTQSVSRSRSKMSGSNANLIEVNIKLPRLDITVAGRARTKVMAEISAAIIAKQAIVKLLQDREDLTAEAKESETFGLTSGVGFWQWYKYQRKDAVVETVSETNRRTSKVTSRITLASYGTDEIREFPAIAGKSKKIADGLASLAAAVQMTNENPDLKARFFKEFNKNNGQILPPLSPVEFKLSHETAGLIQSAINKSGRASSQFDDYDLRESSALNTGRGTIYNSLPDHIRGLKNQELIRRREAYESRADLEELRKTRSEYPMNQYADDVLKTVESSTYSIVIGATGSGKTTQVPQILLNNAIKEGRGADCNIICTQPRRIAAKSVAQRVADERAEFLSDCVGYHVKKEPKPPRYGGSINFVTTGILSAQLQHHADDILDNASHLIIDEVHERDTIIDFLLTTLKTLVKKRLAEGKKVPHITLMSATIDADLFSDYLRIDTPEGKSIDCPKLFVPGRTFPVKELYLEDVMQELKTASGGQVRFAQDRDTMEFISSETEFAKDNTLAAIPAGQEPEQNVTINWVAERKKATAKANMSIEEQESALVPHALAAATIAHIASTTQEGAILTFLPGLEDITKIDELLKTKPAFNQDFNDSSKFKIFMLHSSIPNTQKEVFDPVPPGVRKIILATNIAETSITIPDVQHVVDTGKLRELQYDQQRRITKLACVWASKSNAKQRAGRAGRVQDGNYYALYSKERYQSLRAVGLPELLRSDLQEICLNVKNQGFDTPVQEFLSQTIEPPKAESVNLALDNLKALQALEEDETLTPLGTLLAQLPVHPSLGKMIVLGIIFRCLDPMLIIGSSFGERNIFVAPPDKRRQARTATRAFAKNTLSDHIGMLSAVKEMRMLDEVRGSRAMGDYAMRNFIHIGAYRSILSTADQIEKLLVDQGVIPSTSKMNRAQFQLGDARLNENSDKVGLIKALVLAGFAPNLGARRGRITYRTPRENNVIVHPSSINAIDFKDRDGSGVDHRTQLLAFSELARSADGNSMYLRDTTPVTGLMSLLFSAQAETTTRNIVKMDGWLPFYFQDASQTRTVIQLQRAVQQVTSAAFKDLAARRALVDHDARNEFADSLVLVLDSDLASSSAAQSRSSYERPRASQAFFKPEPRGGWQKTSPGNDNFGYKNSNSFATGNGEYRGSNPTTKSASWNDVLATFNKGGDRVTKPVERSPDAEAARSSIARLFAEEASNHRPSSARAR